jgi:hypothetical protein
LAGLAAALLLATPALAQTPAKQPNIVVIMGDDIGMWNIGAYHRGLMAGRTPNIDRIAGRIAGTGSDHRDGVEVDGLRHRPVRQEPLGRPSSMTRR